MGSRLVATVVLVSLLTGCATVREVDLDAGESQLAEINAAAQRKGVSVELVSGQIHPGRKLDVGSETTCWTEGGRSWIGGGEEDRVCVPTSEVRQITVRRRLKGCLQGAGISLGVGLAAMVAAIFAMPDTDEHAGQAVMFLGAAAIGVSTVVCTVVGVGRGKDVYIINH